MSRLTISFVLSLLFVPGMNVLAQEDGQELIQAHKAAVNPGALPNAQVLKWVGTESSGEGQPSSSFEFLQATEGKWQTIRSTSAATVKETFTGETGWVSSEEGGQLSIIDFAFENPGPIARMSEWGSLLAKAEQYGYEAEYLGLKREGGSMLHEFRMAGKNYDGFMLYLDANTNMIAKVRDIKIIKGRQESVEIVYSDYREIEGAMLPFKIETYKARELKSVVQFETLEINPDVPEDTWLKPISDGQRESRKDGGRG